MKKIEITKLDVKTILVEFLIITFAAWVTATSLFFFMFPSGAAIGSATALAVVLHEFIPLSVSNIALIINVFLLIVGFFLVGSEFGIKTVYTSIIVPVIIGIYERFFPNFVSITGEPVLDVVCHILVMGVAMAMLFSRNASSGGLDIVAKIMSKYLKMDIGKAVSISGIAVAFSSALCSDMKTVVISVLGTYFGGILVDQFIFGMNIKRRVCIISPRLEEITNFILYELHSGASISEIIGAYDNTPRREVVAIVDKTEYRRLMDYVKAIDPTAFVTVYAVNEIRYVPKKWK